jgi:predicted XRE-type DNA-binding protein
MHHRINSQEYPESNWGPSISDESTNRSKSYPTGWAAVAANLRARAELMRQLAACIQRQGWTQAQAAQHCSVTQPRINDLLRGRVSRFFLDALVNIATALSRMDKLTKELPTPATPASPAPLPPPHSLPDFLYSFCKSGVYLGDSNRICDLCARPRARRVPPR